MATTTTWAAIRTQFITKLKAITPTQLADKLFDESPRNYQIREWAEKNPTSSLRRFQWQTQGWGELAQSDPDAYERRESALLTLSYPAQVALYNVDTNSSDYNTMEDIVAADITKVRDVLQSPGNYVSGQSDLRVVGVRYERGDKVWFVELDCEAVYTHDQTLV